MRKKIFLIFSTLSLTTAYVLNSHFTRGMNRLREGHFDLAMEIFEDAQSTESTSVDKMEALYGMALCYWYGVGDIRPDRKLATEMLESVIDEEMKEADIPILSNVYYLLGLYYYDEVKDVEKALPYLEESANLGYALAQFRLGKYYFEKSQESWQDVCGDYQKSDDLAIKYLTDAMNNSNLSRRNRNHAMEMLREIDVSSPSPSWWNEFRYYVITTF